MEQVFDKEKKLFELQAEQDKQSIKQLEARLDVARRTIQEAREDKASVEKEIAQVCEMRKELISKTGYHIIFIIDLLLQIKMKLDHKTLEMLNENTRFQNEARQANSLHHTPSVVNNSQEEVAEVASKLQAAESRIQDLEECLKKTRAAQQKSELLELDVQNLKQKIEKLESEKSLCEEGRTMAARAARASNLEKELLAANKLVANLREAVKGKLLLEEQFCSMQQRYDSNSIVNSSSNSQTSF